MIVGGCRATGLAEERIALVIRRSVAHSEDLGAGSLRRLASAIG